MLQITQNFIPEINYLGQTKMSWCNYDATDAIMMQL